MPDHTFADYQIVDDMHIHLEVSPGWVGANEFVVTLFNIDGSAVTDASLIRVRFSTTRRGTSGRNEVRPTYYAGAEYKSQRREPERARYVARPCVGAAPQQI
ncbi:MAG: hypothetical protein U0703_28245 [Anaerolineae bacterium]